MKRVLSIIFALLITGCGQEKISGQPDTIRPQTVQSVQKFDTKQAPDTVKKIIAVAYALERYKLANQQYPISKPNGDKAGSWDGGLYNDGTVKKDWIPGLYPDYYDQELPMDAKPGKPQDPVYIYKSDGANYILLARDNKGCLWAKNNAQSMLYEPEKEYCLGFGVWTPNAR